MTNRDLLKEAIADAKAVKETAIANAKAALEEAFTPHLKSMLAAKLEEMDKDEEVEESMNSKEEEDMMEEFEVNEEMEEEFDLNEILEELEEEEDMEVMPEEVTEADEEAEGEMEDEEIDLEDMTEDDLKSFIEDVIADMVASGELEAGEESEEEAEMSAEDEIEVEDDMEDMMEADEEQLDEMDEISWNEKTNPTRGATMKEMDPKKVGKTTSAYAINEAEFKKALGEIETLKKELQEVNLLNAKLLFTNKIFKVKNLDENQKIKVLKAFDKAETVKEAKIIFETLNEGMIQKKSPSTFMRDIKGSASRPTGIVSENRQPIVEVDPLVNRWKVLAGIK
jgi:hypothetical protein